MKKILVIIVITEVGLPIYAQQNTSMESYQRDVRFNQDMEKLKSGEKKLGYSDIEGSPYYKTDFLSARFGNNSTIFPIRYNCYTDTIEILNGNEIVEIPKTNIVKESELSKFIFEKSNEILILVDTYDEHSGYFFRIVNGKNQLLKKITIEFKPEIPAPNHLIKSIPARFEKQIITYFIKTENNFVKVPQQTDELLNDFPENKVEINDFIKKNKIKINNEKDLVKLVAFLNDN